MGEVLCEGTYQAGSFADIPAYSAVQYKMPENTFMDFFSEKSAPNRRI